MSSCTYSYSAQYLCGGSDYSPWNSHDFDCGGGGSSGDGSCSDAHSACENEIQSCVSHSSCSYSRPHRS